MKKGYDYNLNRTLCFDCEWASGKDKKCPWANKFEPVPGWKAIPTKLLITSGTQTHDGFPVYTDSFAVKECPLFELHHKLKKEKKR